MQQSTANLKGQIGALIAHAAQAEQRSAEIAIQITRLATTRREEAATQLREVLPQENELTARRLDLRERLSRLEIRAPASGIVMGLQMTTPGAVIRPADLILSIVPQDRPLEIQLQISPLNIDEVHSGQRVRLTFPTFQSRTMPEIWSEVRSLSADAFTDQKSQSSYYRADIVLSPEAIKELGPHNLLPGMPVQAFIQTGNRSPFDYLVKPFEDYFLMAFKCASLHGILRRSWRWNFDSAQCRCASSIGRRVARLLRSCPVHEQPRNRNTIYSRPMRFDMICEANGIEHRLTEPNHPWTNGQVERKNRTIKDATVKRFHYDSHDQLRTHLADFLVASKFARRLKTLSGLTPYEYICKIWTSEPERFILDPIQQMPGLNNQVVERSHATTGVRAFPQNRHHRRTLPPIRERRDCHHRGGQPSRARPTDQPVTRSAAKLSGRRRA